MMALDELPGFYDGNVLSRNDQLKAIGNAVCPPQAKHAIGGLLDRARNNGFKPGWE